jgi:nicotinamidase/pyrazinamidase
MIRPQVLPNLGEALLVIDVQNDFLPGGALAVPRGDDIVNPLNRWMVSFAEAGLPIYATRDCHPPDHCSFQEQNGPWPSHCVKGSWGANFPEALKMPPTIRIVDKPDCRDKETYSAFSGTSLDDALRSEGIDHVWVGGLATEYCVMNTVLDALQLSYRVTLLSEAIRAVDVRSSDGENAIQLMVSQGVILR